jgi:hypothetical protein
MQVKAERFKAAKGLLARARTRDSTQALGKLTTVADRRRRIIRAPPMIVPVEDVFADAPPPRRHRGRPGPHDSAFNPVRALARVVEEHYGAGPAGAAVRAALIGALAPGLAAVRVLPDRRRRPGADSGPGPPG